MQGTHTSLGRQRPVAHRQGTNCHKRPFRTLMTWKAALRKPHSCCVVVHSSAGPNRPYNQDKHYQNWAGRHPLITGSRIAAAFLALAFSLLGTSAPVPASASRTTAEQIQSTSQIASQRGTDPVSETASDVEDQLLETARQLEARLESAFGAVTSGIPGLQATPEEVNQAAHILIQEVWEVVDQYYLDARDTGFDSNKWESLRDAALVKRYNDVPAAYRAIRNMLARGLSDPYCRFITPTELSAMKKYDVTGVGLNLGTATEYTQKTGNPLPGGRHNKEGGVFVVGLSKGSASDKAGVEQGDELLEVDGKALKDSSPFQAASLIQGTSAADDAAGSNQVPSKLQIKLRKPDGSLQVLTLDRPKSMAVSSPVTYRLSRNNGQPVGNIKLTSFNARAQRDLAKAVQDLEAAGASIFVLDLRDNRGGLVSEGLEVARLFLEGNVPIVFTESKSMSGDAPLAQGPALTHKPLLVLVNDHTASASEIVAGALKDNCRAVLAGSRTYGKGLIQSVYELSDGSGLVITVGKYLTPNRTDIDRFGIKPDFSGTPSREQIEATLQACLVQKQANRA